MRYLCSSTRNGLSPPAASESFPLSLTGFKGAHWHRCHYGFSVWSLLNFLNLWMFSSHHMWNCMAVIFSVFFCCLPYPHPLP